MSRFEDVANIYKEIEAAHEDIMRSSPNNLTLIRTLTFVDISQSLKNIDITLAKLYDREVENENHRRE